MADAPKLLSKHSGPHGRLEGESKYAYEQRLARMRVEAQRKLRAEIAAKKGK